jgi:hypothetical protein
MYNGNDHGSEEQSKPQPKPEPGKEQQVTPKQSNPKSAAPDGGKK